MDEGCFQNVIFEGQGGIPEGSEENIAWFHIEGTTAWFGILLARATANPVLSIHMPEGTRGALYPEASGWRFEPAPADDETARLLAEAQKRAQSLEYMTLILNSTTDPLARPAPRVEWGTSEGWWGTQGGRSLAEELREFLERTVE